MRKVITYNREIDPEDSKRFDERPNADKIVSDINLVRLDAVGEGESVLTTSGERYTKINGVLVQENIQQAASSTPSVTTPGALGEVNTASNIGTGEGTVFKEKNVADLIFKTIKAGTNISITNDTNEIIINATAASVVLLMALTVDSWWGLQVFNFGASTILLAE
jgi:hypothetical protein